MPNLYLKSKESIARHVLFDINGNELTLDSFTNTLTVIDFAHYKNHIGEHYFYSDFALLLNLDDTIEFILTPTTKTIHIRFNLFTLLKAKIEVFSNPSGIVGGTNIDIYANNDSSETPSTLTIIKDPTSINNNGIKRYGFLTGTDKTVGVISENNEFILKNNIYLVRITSLIKDNDISWNAQWYEH